MIADHGNVSWRDCSILPTMNKSFRYLVPAAHPWFWAPLSVSVTGGLCLAFAYTGRICVGFVSSKSRKRSANSAFISSNFFLYLESSNFSSS